MVLERKVLGEVWVMLSVVLEVFFLQGSMLVELGMELGLCELCSVCNVGVVFYVSVMLLCCARIII